MILSNEIKWSNKKNYLATIILNTKSKKAQLAANKNRKANALYI